MPKQRTLDDALKEKSDLMREYNAMKRARRDELYASEPYGKSLKRFVATLNHFGPEHSDRMVEYVSQECLRWLGNAPIDIRYAALEACGDRERAVRLKMRLPPYDDGVPGGPANVYRRCKAALGL
jgi:hypothetical protein